MTTAEHNHALALDALRAFRDHPSIDTFRAAQAAVQASPDVCTTRAYAEMLLSFTSEHLTVIGIPEELRPPMIDGLARQAKRVLK